MPRTWQRYTNSVAVERMAAGLCPECGEPPQDHTGSGLGRCSLTDTGAAGRIWQYQEDEGEDPIAHDGDRCGDLMAQAETDVLNELVERIRAASFEAPKAGSHTEWAGRIKAMFAVVCAECGVSEEGHGDHGDFHESGDPAFTPLAYYVSLERAGDSRD